jgi:hypothetical protein
MYYVDYVPLKLNVIPYYLLLNVHRRDYICLKSNFLFSLVCLPFSFISSVFNRGVSTRSGYYLNKIVGGREKCMGVDEMTPDDDLAKMTGDHFRTVRTALTYVGMH